MSERKLLEVTMQEERPKEKSTKNKVKISRMVREEILDRAKRHIFSSGIGDGSSQLARENMRFGLAKIHWVQEERGLEPNATFISTPDEGVTRNVHRWEAGISYGGKVSWGDGKERLVVLDTKPNACGMLVGILPEIPDPVKLVRRLYEFEKIETRIKGVPVTWDFNVGNHFLDVFKVRDREKHSRLDSEYVAIVHSGCPELKADNPAGFGLYWHKSRLLSEMAKVVQTPFGDARVLDGKGALEYFRFFNFAERFAQRRRELIFYNVLDGEKIICNVTHQGLINLNEHILGSQIIKSERTLMPISIRADMPSWLVHGIKNFSDVQIEMMGWNKRSRELGVYKRLRKANLLPHGGGYMFQDSLKIEKVFEANSKRFFIIDMVDGVGKKIISNVNELEYAYRSTEILARVEEIGMARMAAELMPIFTIKI